MMLSKVQFKGISSIVLENEELKCIILPEYGGKLASLYDKKAEYEWLFQEKKEKLEIPPYAAVFSEYDSSGFDEIFPGIDKGLHPSNGKTIPDHGEVWAMPWTVTSESNDGLELEVKSTEFPYTLKKEIKLNGKKLQFRYEAINHSDEDFSFIWTPHALLNFNSSTMIEVPEGMDEVITVEHSTAHLGEWGTLHSYPKTTSLQTGEVLDLSRIAGSGEGTSEKFYFVNKLSEGWCRAVQPDLFRMMTYSFPLEKVPYLGLWKTEGGYRGDYNFALEPCTGVYDDVYVAQRIEKVSKIPANGTYSWWFDMTVESI